MSSVVEAFIIIALLIPCLCSGINIYSYLLRCTLNTSIQSGQFCDDGIPIKLAHHLDKDDGYFSSTVVTTGNENENDDSLNTYSQIGVITGSDRSTFLDQNNFYTFKLKYITLETNSSQILIWKQTSWLTIGYTPISIPARTNDWRTPLSNFNGLARQHRVPLTYLSSVNDVVPSSWFNAVCTTGCNDCITEFYHLPTPAQNYSGGGDQPDGIICYDSLTCRSMEFYICQYPQTNNPTTSEPTSTPPTSSNPTTATPTSTPSESSYATELPTTASPTTDHPTTSQPTTSEQTSTSPTTSNLTTFAPTTTPSEAPYKSESPTTVSPSSANLIVQEDVNSIDGRNESEIPATSSDETQDFLPNEANSSSDIVYYIIGGAALCCIGSSILMYYLYLTRKNKTNKQMLANERPKNAPAMEISHKSDTQIHSHTPYNDQSRSTEPPKFVNDLDNLSSVNSMMMATRGNLSDNEQIAYKDDDEPSNEEMYEVLDSTKDCTDNGHSTQGEEQINSKEQQGVVSGVVIDTDGRDAILPSNALEQNDSMVYI